MARLIVVSNRVPLPDKDGSPPPGGMAIALNAALKRQDGLWIGWSGEVKPEEKEDEPPRLSVREAGGITYALTDLAQKDLDEYYNGFANRVLWPIFHCRVDLAEYARHEMSGYYRVNRLFADLLMPLLQEDDVIWVHDYHLIPLAEELRKRGCRNRIGFFLHIPWPPADILFTVPIYDTLLRGLSSYDLVGFHTDYDLSNFAECLRREGCGDLLEGGYCRAYGRVFRCGVFPISIDTAEFETLAEQSAGDKALRMTYRRIEGYDVAIGVDRLDYSKGIDQRVEAFRRFLHANAHRVGKTLLLQITPKSRTEVPEYMAMQKDIAELTGRVNGELGTIDWMPVHYINQSLERRELAGLYRMARVGLVTPLRDGMNLVAKEYVAAQHPQDPGVLILSRFAGAARELDGAILVNPYDPEAVANAIERALVMPLDARVERWNAMMTRLREHDVYRWCDEFLSGLRQA
ncbi:alpha,alpha-trehalose-phosphate synthase (UDP-forming) [Ensifer aridi]|uniref:alpha,alpha-trehalose-phosphate synthase (UDP-forming) n=1 Tax=Ensifer aridi TaxID=1708715 RepID=UPI000A1056EE|nr:alpha,alpha-trehalose-phosphate synthase (UDP-forming) [Ensifer aridi]